MKEFTPKNQAFLTAALTSNAPSVVKKASDTAAGGAKRTCVLFEKGKRKATSKSLGLFLCTRRL